MPFKKEIKNIRQKKVSPNKNSNPPINKTKRKSNSART